MRSWAGEMLLVCRCICLCYVLIFFFFQAEDGIRDYKVTGVQTCALPIWCRRPVCVGGSASHRSRRSPPRSLAGEGQCARRDRKSTRLNSSHLVISYAVFCLKKKK